MRFAKLHGLGNDFVLLDFRQGGRAISPQRVLELCDRNRGIGADGVLTLLEGDRMLVQNADGSVPEMCGNGARCVALWVATRGCTQPASATVTLNTDAGPQGFPLHNHLGKTPQITSCFRRTQGMIWFVDRGTPGGENGVTDGKAERSNVSATAENKKPGLMFCGQAPNGIWRQVDLFKHVQVQLFADTKSISSLLVLIPNTR